MLAIITILIFAAAYAIKGGQLAHIFKNYEAVKERNQILKAVLSGKVLSTIIVLAFGYINNEWLLSAGWLLAIMPSLGEEYGAILNQGKYVDAPEFGRSYGVKKSIERGVWSGAMMAIATGSTSYIWFSLLFVALAYLALHAGKRFKFDGTALSEILIGGICYGIPTYLVIS